MKLPQTGQIYYIFKLAIAIKATSRTLFTIPKNLSKRAEKLWQAKRASNPQPSVLETDTLPIELLACCFVKRASYLITIYSNNN
jgi:hypothetical protein